MGKAYLELLVYSTCTSAFNLQTNAARPIIRPPRRFVISRALIGSAIAKSLNALGTFTADPGRLRTVNQTEARAAECLLSARSISNAGRRYIFVCLSNNGMVILLLVRFHGAYDSVVLMLA